MDVRLDTCALSKPSFRPQGDEVYVVFWKLTYGRRLSSRAWKWVPDHLGRSGFHGTWSGLGRACVACSIASLSEQRVQWERSQSEASKIGTLCHNHSPGNRGFHVCCTFQKLRQRVGRNGKGKTSGKCQYLGTPDSQGKSIPHYIWIHLGFFSWFYLSTFCWQSLTVQFWLAWNLLYRQIVL